MTGRLRSANLMPDLAARAAAVRASYNDCFGCGLDNPAGLHLDRFAIAADGLTAEFNPRPEHRGFDGILHGGIVAALLDETMAWTAMMLENTFVVTANLELKYRKPAPAVGRYRLLGRVDERRGRRLKLAATAATEGVTIAEASGLFLATEPVG